MAERQFGAKREARRAVRRLVDLECAVYSELWGEAIEHQVTDVSEDGLWIQTELLLEVGAEVMLNFQPPDSEQSLCVAGRVQRVELRRRAGEGRSVGMGIAFEAMRADERRRLTRSMRGLRARESCILSQHTLTGVPVGVAEPLASATDPKRTIVGWAAPSSADDDAVRPSRIMPTLPGPHAGRMLYKSAFTGGLDLAASVFAAPRSD